MRLIVGEGGCVFSSRFFAPSLALLCPWTHAQLVLEGSHGCFERDVRREELVHVNQRATAGILGCLHGVQTLSDVGLDSRRTHTTQAARCCGCPLSAPETAVWDTRAAAESASRNVERPDGIGNENLDLCNDGRGLLGVRPSL
ncbi:unnamed protein product [Ectocarpus sp. 12 AP-2014]